MKLFCSPVRRAEEPIKAERMAETAHAQRCGPLPERARQHVCASGDLNLEKALSITRAAAADEVPINFVFQVTSGISIFQAFYALCLSPSFIEVLINVVLEVATRVHTSCLG